MSARRSALALPLLFVFVAACEWKVVNTPDDDGRQSANHGTAAHSGDGETGSTPSSCAVKVDRYKELIVINRSALLDRRAQNGVTDAAWSFRSRMEDLVSGGNANVTASEFTFAWLDQWRTVTSVGPDYAPVKTRPKVGSVLVDPWRAKGGSLADAPFRLIAIVNRPDLRQRDDACKGFPGELRFVYTAVEPESGKALPMTVIIEIPYPATRSPRQWIEAWHALADKPFGEDFNRELGNITAEAVAGSLKSTWRVRTNEIAFASDGSDPWEMRDFALRGSALVQIPIASTPRIELDRSPSLDEWAKENESSIRDGSYVLPGGFQAGAAPISSSSFRWSSTRMDPEVRQKLSMGTCNGCHGGERSGETSLPFQHIAAPDQPTAYYGSSRDGETRLSRWLDSSNGPSSSSGSGNDELSRRETSMARALCASACPPVANPEPSPTKPYQR